MALDFDKYAMKGNEFLNILARKLGHEHDRDRAARVVRSVFHSLRRHLSTEESMQLLAQLPMALKSVYVDGWQIAKHQERIHTFDDLVNEIVQEEGKNAWKDFDGREDVIFGMRSVVETMAHYVSKGELEQAFGTLPEGLKKAFVSWL